jgi:hypothetical protein
MVELHFHLPGALRALYALVVFYIAVQFALARFGLFGYFFGNTLLVRFHPLNLHITAANADRTGLALGIGCLGLDPGNILLHAANFLLLILISSLLFFYFGLALFKIVAVAASIFAHAAFLFIHL